MTDILHALVMGVGITAVFALAAAYEQWWSNRYGEDDDTD